MSNLSNNGIPRLEHSYHIVWNIQKTYPGHLSMVCSYFGHVQVLPCSLSRQAPTRLVLGRAHALQLDQRSFTEHLVPAAHASRPGFDPYPFYDQVAILKKIPFTMMRNLEEDPVRRRPGCDRSMRRILLRTDFTIDIIEY